MTTTTSTSLSPPASGYYIKVSLNGQATAYYVLADLDKMPTVTISASGQSYTGPTISAIIAQAGIKDFTKVTVYGWAKGRLATASLLFNKADLNNNLILRPTNTNTYSMASPDVNSNSWIIDVNELKVE
jgi:hypothetical protein